MEPYWFDSNRRDTLIILKKGVGTTKYTKHTKEKGSVSNEVLNEWVNDLVSNIGSFFVYFVYFVV